MSEYTKIFVGNLSFKTRGQDLAGEFSAVGKVIDANIITRGNRSLGYGFVDMDTEENATKAVAVMNKKNVDGRDINVELARPRDEEKIAERKARQQQQRQKKREPRKDGDEGEGGETAANNNEEKSADSSNSGVGAASPSQRPRNSFRKPRYPRKPRTSAKEGEEEKKNEDGFTVTAAPARKPRTSVKEGEADKKSDVSDDKNDSSPKPNRARKPRRPQQPRKEGEAGEKKENSGENNEASSAGPSDEKRRERRERAPRPAAAREDGNSDGERRSSFPRRPRRNNTSRLEGGTPSSSSLFVANLPYAVDNQSLEEAFAAYNVKSAKVIINKYGRSKGFGFVELATEKDQLAALAGMHDKPLQGRTIAVKVAIVLKPREEQQQLASNNNEKPVEAATEKPKEAEGK